MKFTVFALLPAVAWSILTLYSAAARFSVFGTMTAGLFVIWPITWFVLFVYWVVRLVRYAWHGSDERKGWPQ